MTTLRDRAVAAGINTIGTSLIGISAIYPALVCIDAYLVDSPCWYLLLSLLRLNLSRLPSGFPLSCSFDISITCRTLGTTCCKAWFDFHLALLVLRWLLRFWWLPHSSSSVSLLSMSCVPCTGPLHWLWVYPPGSLFGAASCCLRLAPATTAALLSCSFKFCYVCDTRVLSIHRAYCEPWLLSRHSAMSLLDDYLGCFCQFLVLQYGSSMFGFTSDSGILRLYCAPSSPHSWPLGPSNDGFYFLLPWRCARLFLVLIFAGSSDHCAVFCTMNPSVTASAASCCCHAANALGPFIDRRYLLFQHAEACTCCC